MNLVPCAVTFNPRDFVDPFEQDKRLATQLWYDSKFECQDRTICGNSLTTPDTVSIISSKVAVTPPSPI